MNLHTITKVTFAAGLIMSLSTACKATRRGIPGGSGVVSFTVKLLGPIENETVERKNAWVYELSGCIAPTQADGINEENEVTFKASGISPRSAAPCQIKAKSLDVEAFATAFKSPEPGTFYMASQVPVNVNAYGKYYTEISLDKVYTALTGETPPVVEIEKEKEKKEEEEKGPNEVIVEATAEDCTAEGKVFDIESKTCKDL